MDAVQKNYNPVISYSLALFALFILLFFTRGYFSQLQELLDTREQLQQESVVQEQELTKLNEIQTLLAQEGNPEKKNIQGFLGTFSEADMLEYIYSYAQKVNLTNDRIIIRDMSLSENGVNDIGFDTATINISAIFSSEDTLFAFLNFMIQEGNTYRFYIDQFDYPMNNTSGNIQVSLPLTLYYKK